MAAPYPCCFSEITIAPDFLAKNSVLSEELLSTTNMMMMELWTIMHWNTTMKI
jgi:hypothetical protein